MLSYTPKEVSERKALRVNPAKTCQPVGAMYAALGVHACLPHSHGSQGCCAFHRMFLTRHFKDPVMAASSSFTEGASVFGGGANLKQAVRNIFDLYNPDIIAVHTTCLSETIGDDLNALIIDISIPEGKYVVHCNTPSYKGSHITGFSNMVAGFINYLSESTGNKQHKITLIPGFVNPGDMREYKRIMKFLGVEYTMLPDTTGVCDSPMTGTYEMYPKGGTTIPEIVGLGDTELTVALGELTSTFPAQALEKKCKVPYKEMPLPIGVEATDNFIMELMTFSQNEVPFELEEERGQLIDIMVDIHPYTYGKKVAIFGDPDTVLGLANYCLELGMIPKYMVTGTPGAAFEKKAQALLEKFGVEGCQAKANADLFLMHQWIKNEKVDLLLGTTHGKHIARAEDIPFVRAGFPIIDRYVHSYMPLVGYKGAIRLAELICNALLDYQDRTCDEKDLEVVL